MKVYNEMAVVLFLLADFFCVPYHYADRKWHAVLINEQHSTYLFNS